LVRNPFRPAARPAVASDRSVVVEVELDGNRHTVAWPVRRRLLTVLRDAGLAVPSSCEEGRCGL
jgi:3-ketosteroid 9alpha-monooxygenase subunit B